jgi:hypothetical protein
MPFKDPAERAAWKLANKAKLAEYRKTYRVRHPNKVKKQITAWKDANPEAVIRHRQVSFEKSGFKVIPGGYKASQSS